MLGAPFQPAPGLLVLSASKLRDFQSCRQRFHLAHVLGLRGDGDVDGLGTGPGLHVHAELHARHAQPQSHGPSHGPTHDGPDHSNEETPDDPAVNRAVRAHIELCPGDTAHYLGGEIDLRWFAPGKALLVTGRVDAMWRYPDGTLEVRDYKTGAVPDVLDNDPGALLYALLAATQPASAQPSGAPGPVRVVYERLGGERPGIVSLDVTADVLTRARRAVFDLADDIRRERHFPASPHPARCRMCPFISTCPEGRSTL